MDDDDWTTASLALVAKSPKKGGKKKKKQPKEEDWMTKRDRDLKHCQSVAGSWLAFSLSQAPWVNLSSNTQLRNAFSAPCDMQSLESIDEWTTAVQQALCYYVLLDMIMKEDDRGESRVQQFQALGRGWIFILLHSKALTKYDKMKVWFESSERVLHDHEMDMRAAELTGSTRDKYLWGYNPEAEIVFFLKGLAPARPLVCIQRLRPDYRDLDKWAIKPGAKIKCLDGKLPSDAEREKVVQQHKRRKNQRKKEKARQRQQKEAEREVAERVSAEILALLRPDSAAGRGGHGQQGAAAAGSGGGEAQNEEGSKTDGGFDAPPPGGPAAVLPLSLSLSSASSSDGSTALAAPPPPAPSALLGGEGGAMLPGDNEEDGEVPDAGVGRLIRSATTPYGTGLVKKFRDDGSLVLEMQWSTSSSEQPTSVAASTGSTAIVAYTANSNASGTGGGEPASSKSRGGALMYVPRPYGALLRVETFEEHEEERRREKEERDFGDTESFEEMLAAMKAEDAAQDAFLG